MEEVNQKLNKMQKMFDKKRAGADIWDDGDEVYIECTKSIDPVKDIIKDFGFEIRDEHECSGSDYDSYIITLDVPGGVYEEE